MDDCNPPLRLLLSCTIFIAVASTALAQEHCVSALRYGLYDYFNQTNTAYDRSSFKRDLCDQYEEFKKDTVAGDAKASYGTFDGSVSFSRDQLSSIGKMYCENEQQSAAAGEVAKTSSRYISDAAMESYRQCLELSRKGLRASFSLHPEDDTKFTVELSYLSVRNGTRPKVTGVEIAPKDQVTCSGTLAEAFLVSKPAPMELSSAFSMLCNRKIVDPIEFRGRNIVAPSASVLIETEEASVTYHLTAIPEYPLPDDLTIVRNQLPPDGSVLLMIGECPSPYYQDITSSLSGRYIIASSDAIADVVRGEGDGSHSHTATHDHTVTAQSAPLSLRRARFGGNNFWAHYWDNNSVVSVTGTTSSAQQTFSGGQHTHVSAGFRLCQKVAQSAIVQR